MVNRSIKIINCVDKADKERNMKYIFFVIIAGIGWGTAGMFVNSLTGIGFSNMQIASIRCLNAFISSFVFILITNPQKLKITLKQIFVCAIIGFMFFFMAYFYYVAMKRTSYSVASILLDMASLVVLAFSILFFREKLTLKKIIAVLTALIGSGLVTGILTGVSVDLYGVGFALISCLCYAAYSILIKIAVKMKMDTISITVYCFLFSSLISFFFINPVSTVNIALNGPWYTILLSLGIGIFTGSMPGYLYSIAMTKIPAGTVASVACIEPLASAVFAILFLGEKISVLTGIGIAMILTAVTILARETE